MPEQVHHLRIEVELSNRDDIDDADSDTGLYQIGTFGSE
jgi:hypothetical protein